jgi:tRNA(Ile)-lysidine synthase
VANDGTTAPVIAAALDRCDFPMGDPLALGVSGGPDSVAMALLARAAGREAVIWHVHHGIRPEADEDADLVGSFAADLGVPFELRRVELEPGADLEARARAARYDMLPADVCVGHTADDRAETVLLNLFRGAGMAGVAARMGRVNRPILRLRRAETVRICAAAGARVVDDSMNHDPTFTRVGVRARVVPTLADVFDRDPVPLLNRHADHVADALEVVRAEAAALDPTDTASLREAPRAVATEALRAWIAARLQSPVTVDLASIDRVMSVVDGTHVATEIEGGHRVARTDGVLRLERR